MKNKLFLLGSLLMTVTTSNFVTIKSDDNLEDLYYRLLHHSPKNINNSKHEDSSNNQAPLPSSNNQAPLPKYIGPMPQELEEAVFMFKHQNAFDKLGVDVPLGYLLYGPPGTGKTFVGQHFASTIGAEFKYVRGSEIQDEFVGGHRKVEMLFQSFRNLLGNNKNKKKRLVIFLDELDCLIGKRSDNNNANHKEKIGAFLREIDGMKLKGAIILGATNHINSIDPAILRNGRLGIHIECKLPDEKTKIHFLQETSLPYQNYFDHSIDWTKVAKNCNKCNYADLQEMINAAKRRAIKRSIIEGGAPILVLQDDMIRPNQ